MDCAWRPWGRWRMKSARLVCMRPLYFFHDDARLADRHRRPRRHRLLPVAPAPGLARAPANRGAAIVEPGRRGPGAGRSRAGTQSRCCRNCRSTIIVRISVQGRGSRRAGALDTDLRQIAFTFPGKRVCSPGARRGRSAEEEALATLEVRIHPAGIENAGGIKSLLQRLVQAKLHRIEWRKRTRALLGGPKQRGMAARATCRRAYLRRRRARL